MYNFNRILAKKLLIMYNFAQLFEEGMFFMADTLHFIKKFGDKSFCDVPFCDVDNAALCEIFYMPLEKVVSESFTAEPKSFTDACNELYSYNGNKHKAPGLILMRKMSVKMMEMSKQKRYSEMKIVAATEVYRERPAVQFAAATFILPDGNIVVIFRGTDDTLAGWKEDLDIYTKREIPSHRLALEYLENVAKNFDGDITVCGHSKGGNLALYAALKCSDETRSRIKVLYNNEGPGFVDYTFYRTPAYAELLPKYRHFVPSASFIGMMLAHDDDYMVVKSKQFLGPLQHDLSSWKVKGTELSLRPELNIMGKATDYVLKNLIFRLNDAQLVAMDKVVDVIFEGTGQENLLGFAKHAVSSVKGAKKTWSELDEDTRETFKSSFKGTGEIVKDAIKTVRAEGAEDSQEAAVETVITLKPEPVGAN